MTSTYFLHFSALKASSAMQTPETVHRFHWCDPPIALVQFTFGEEGFFAEPTAAAGANWWQRVVNSW